MEAVVVGALAVSSFFVSAALTSRFCDPSSRFHLLDHPNERSLHTRPTARTGGIAIFAAALAGLLVTAAWQHTLSLLWLLAAWTVIVIVSFVDDVRGVSAVDRFLAHLVAAVLLLIAGFPLREFALPGWGWAWPAFIGIPFSLLFVVWMVNLYNFMDGMDGFAGGMAVIGFGFFAVLGWSAGHTAFTGVSLTIAGASAGFLVFNFPPARIFMGDVGSASLGFLAAALSLWGARDAIFPFWAALLIFSPFIVDATFTLVRRAARGERVWQAHKTHCYQRLVQAGWGHKKTVIWAYVVMFAAGASAVWATREASTIQWLVLGGWLAVYVGLIAAVSHLEEGRQT